MKIAIDYTPVEDSPAGIGQYTVSLLTKLIELAPHNEYLIYSTRPLLLDKSSKNVVIKKHRLPASGILWMSKVAQNCKKQDVDILISPSNHLFTLLFPRTIQFIYDIAPIKYPQFFSKKFSLLFKQTTKIALKRALKIVTISETVRNELVAFNIKQKEDIVISYPAVNTWFTKDPLNNEAVIEKYNLPHHYLLALSTVQPRKNFEHVIKGFIEYKTVEDDPELKLVIVGKKGWKFTGVDEQLQDPKIKNEIITLGYVPNKELSAIYKNAKAFINLSYYEGFGMPILESLYMGLPTIVSKIPTYEECFPKGPFFVEPDNIQDIKKGIKKAVTTKKLDYDNVVNKYSWSKSAKVILKIINERN